ncbi:MAG: hypothetical protein Q4C42_09855 [Clostridia bacterium]|nr:hypothetical protein [Clostridia bacterium]
MNNRKYLIFVLLGLNLVMIIMSLMQGNTQMTVIYSLMCIVWIILGVRMFVFGNKKKK